MAGQFKSARHADIKRQTGIAALVSLPAGVGLNIGGDLAAVRERQVRRDDVEAKTRPDQGLKRLGLEGRVVDVVVVHPGAREDDFRTVFILIRRVIFFLLADKWDRRRGDFVRGESRRRVSGMLDRDAAIGRNPRVEILDIMVHGRQQAPGRDLNFRIAGRGRGHREHPAEEHPGVRLGFQGEELRRRLFSRGDRESNLIAIRAHIHVWIGDHDCDCVAHLETPDVFQHQFSFAFTVQRISQERRADCRRVVRYAEAALAASGRSAPSAARNHPRIFVSDGDLVSGDDFQSPVLPELLVVGRHRQSLHSVAIGQSDLVNRGGRPFLADDYQANHGELACCQPKVIANSVPVSFAFTTAGWMTALRTSAGKESGSNISSGQAINSSWPSTLQSS